MIMVEQPQSSVSPANDLAAKGISPSTSLAVGPAKIKARHRERLAIVYIRQSSPQQVVEHRESTALQYNLQRLAVEWGWSKDRVLVIDQDLGRSGSSAEGRLGFQQLLAEVTLDHVGLVLGIEMSRLARSCKDWHHLLELCAVFGTLLADQEGLYDPLDYNDRLLLGLKGTLSEAELHILRQRMDQGRMNKARRGELFNHAPIGYIRGPSGALELDPDEQVQGVVRLVFDKFDELGSIHSVLMYMVRHDMSIGIRPHRGEDRGRLQWRRPNRQTLASMLKHPVYAGAYSWGRRRTDPRRKLPGRPATGRVTVPPEHCAVLIKDRCPAYITWDRFVAIRNRLQQNRARSDTWGAARDGPSLLAGMVVCGQCGQRMLVAYRGRAGALRYVCQRNRMAHGAPSCQGLSGHVLEECASRQILRVLEPAALELSLTAAADIERERGKLVQHWEHRLERARYDAQRAARQYQVVEPENRLVARELEQRWEQTLLEQREVEEAYERFRREQPPGLKKEDCDAIRTLASDIPTIWNSPLTTPLDRKTIARCLIERVVVAAPQDSQLVDMAIHWAGGFISHHELERPIACYGQLRDYSRLIDRMFELRDAGLTTGRIAKQLNNEGWHPARRRLKFNKDIVRHLLMRQGRMIPRPVPRSAPCLAQSEWWFIDLVRALQVPQATLYSWIRRGWVNARQLPGARGKWIVLADADELHRLRRLRECERTWGGKPREPELTQPKPQGP